MQIRKQRFLTLFVVWMAVLMILGCGTGYSFTYPAHFGEAGQVIVRNDNIQGDDTIHVQIDENFSWDEVALDITVAVESGALQVVFIDDKGQILNLSAVAGQPASGHVDLETDARGNINLQLSGENATGVSITINFARK